MKKPGAFVVTVGASLVFTGYVYGFVSGFLIGGYLVLVWASGRGF